MEIARLNEFMIKMSEVSKEGPAYYEKTVSAPNPLCTIGVRITASHR